MGMTDDEIAGMYERVCVWCAFVCVWLSCRAQNGGLS